MSTQPAPPEPPSLPLLPWEAREQIGFGSAIVENAQLFLTRPREAFSRARRPGDLLSPILWTVLMAFAAAVFRALWGLLIAVPMSALLERRGGPLASLLASGAGNAVNVIVGPILAVAALFIAAAILHACLALLGALQQSRFGYEGTLRVVAYAGTPQLAAVIPLVGGVIGAIWTLALLVVGFEVMHDTTQGRSLAAVLIPLLVCCLCGALVFGLFGAALAALISHRA